MAYLHSGVETADGSGRLSLDWHRVKAQVYNLTADDSRGDIQIKWVRDITVGVKACLSVEEARALVESLSTALAQFDTELGTVATCVECGAAIELLGNDIDRWWTHQGPVLADHDAVPATPEEVA